MRAISPASTVSARLTLNNWNAKDSGIDVSDAKRPQALEDENARLKKLLANQMLEAAALKELLSKNGRPRLEAQSRCASAGCDGPVGTVGLLHHRRGPEDGALPVLPTSGNEPAQHSLRELSNERRRSGYQAVHSVAARGRTLRGQPHLSALPGSRPDDSQAPGTATNGTRATFPDRDKTERTLVAGLRA